jgi:hypothetical protein
MFVRGMIVDFIDCNSASPMNTPPMFSCTTSSTGIAAISLAMDHCYFIRFNASGFQTQWFDPAGN